MTSETDNAPISNFLERTTSIRRDDRLGRIYESIAAESKGDSCQRNACNNMVHDNKINLIER